MGHGDRPGSAGPLEPTHSRRETVTAACVSARRQDHAARRKPRPGWRPAGYPCHRLPALSLLPDGSRETLRRRARWRRWLLRPLAWLAGALALIVVALQALLHSLDRPWIKGRLTALVRSSAGVDIDYASARVDLLSGLAVEGLVVRSPPAVQAFAPDLVRVGHLAAGWSPRSILGSGGPRVETVEVKDVALTVAVDEEGKTSFDALVPPGPTPAPAPGPKTPLSGQAAKLLAAPLPVDRIAIDGVSLALVRTDHGAVAERTELRGLAATIATAPAAPTARLASGSRVDLQLGTPDAPLMLELTRSRAESPAASAKARLWVAVGATSEALTAALDLRMIEQTFAAGPSPDRWLHAEAGLRFDPAAGHTAVSVSSIEAGDGAVKADASIDLPDAGDPVVQRAHVDVDVARLLQWVPAGLVPVTAARAHVRCEAESLVVAAAGDLPARGTLDVDAELSNVAVRAPGPPIDVREGSLTLHAQTTDAGALAGKGSVKLDGVEIASGDARLSADGVGLDLDGRRADDGAIAGKAALHLARLARSGSAPVEARDAHVDLDAENVRPDLAHPVATRGDVALSIALASLDARSPGARATLEGLALRVHTALTGHAPYAAELATTLARLRVVDRGGHTLVDAPARIDVRARDVQPDLARPAASRGAVTATVDVAGAQVSLEATKAPDAVDYALKVDAPSLGVVRPFLPPDLIAQAPWDRMALRVRSSGRLESLGGPAPALRHTTQVDVDRPAFAGIAARSLSLALRSQGTSVQHHVDADIALPGLTFFGDHASDDRVTLSAAIDRARPSLDLKVATQGRAAANLTASVRFDPSRRAVLFAIDGRLGGLAPLAPFAAKVPGLDAFDLSALGATVSAHGALLGVVARATGDGSLELEPNPARTAAVEGEADVRVDHFRWAKGDTAIITPSLQWHGAMHTAADRRTLDSRLEVGTLHLDLGIHDVDLNGIRLEGTATAAGDLSDPDLQVAQRLAVGAVTQDVAPEYPLGDLTFALDAARNREGVVHLSEAKLANGAGGTALAVSGNVDLGEGRRSLSLDARLTQDLARLAAVPDRFKGRGQVDVNAAVTSPDLALFTVHALVKGDGVSLALPHAGVDVQTANGEVPITVALEVGPKGVALARTERRSPYSMLRFADQHPLLAHSGFLSIARLTTPFATIAPLVGNLELEQNFVSLRQFEMGVRGGTITGQCGLDWNGPKSTVELHVRASGVQSSHGEPFDGNFSVIVSAGDRTVEGRAEILRIGERHLLDLLDLQDPLHVDPAMNQIRTELYFGYPDTLHLIFDHGFASAHLQMGGLARLVSVDLPAIPMGPIMDKLIGPLLEGPEMKEAQ